MDVKVRLVKIYIFAIAAASGIRQCRPDRLLHHVTEHPRQNQLAFARYFSGFNRQRFAAYARPRKTRSNTYAVFLGSKVGIARYAQKLVQVFFGNHYFFRAIYNFFCGLAAQRSDFAVQIAHPGFAHIVAH